MANRDWIARIVNTESRLCPLLDRRCLTHQCAFWITETLRDGADVEVQAGCLLAFQYVMGHEIVLESMRAQATADKMATQVRDAGMTVAQALVFGRSANARQLEGR